MNVEPAPTSLFTQIRPPWSSTNFRESASPSPVPSAFLSAVAHLPELLEDRLLILGRDADARIRHGHLRRPRRAAGR